MVTTMGYNFAPQAQSGHSGAFPRICLEYINEKIYVLVLQPSEKTAYHGDDCLSWFQIHSSREATKIKNQGLSS